MNDKAKEADLRLYSQMKEIMTMIEERYGLNQFKIGDKVRVSYIHPEDGSDEFFVGTIQAINDFTGSVQIGFDFYHPAQCRKITN